MGAFSAGFRHVATAMLVMVSSRCFCERGGELWDVVAGQTGRLDA